MRHISIPKAFEVGNTDIGDDERCCSQCVVTAYRLVNVAIDIGRMNAVELKAFYERDFLPGFADENVYLTSVLALTGQAMPSLILNFGISHER